MASAPLPKYAYIWLRALISIIVCIIGPLALAAVVFWLSIKRNITEYVDRGLIGAAATALDLQPSLLMLVVLTMDLHLPCIYLVGFELEQWIPLSHV